VRNRRTLAALAALIAVAASFVSGARPSLGAATAPRIRQQSCFVIFVGSGTIDDNVAAGLRVRWTIESPQTLKTIVWRTTTEFGTTDFTADGTFSPNVSIYRSLTVKGTKYHVPFNKLVPHALEEMGPGLCSVVRTVNADGEVWEAPNAAPPAFDVPTPTPATAEPIPSSYDNPDHNPIGIVSCQFTLQFRGQSWGYVRYKNLSPRTIDSVTFRATFRGGAALDYVNDGRFSPGATIRADIRRGDLPPRTYREYLQPDAPSSCVAVRAHFAGGESWLNPKLPAEPPPFPDPVP
jgi:hypothetical protein